MKKVRKKVRYGLGVLAMFLLVLAGNMTAYAADTPSIEYTLYNANGEKKTEQVLDSREVRTGIGQQRSGGNGGETT